MRGDFLYDARKGSRGLGIGKRWGGPRVGTNGEGLPDDPPIARPRGADSAVASKGTGTMALTKADLAAIASMISTGIADALAVNDAAPPRAASSTTTARSADGRDFPCTVGDGCDRMLRSPKRAGIHGIDAGGHAPHYAAE